MLCQLELGVGRVMDKMQIKKKILKEGKLGKEKPADALGWPATRPHSRP